MGMDIQNRVMGEQVVNKFTNVTDELYQVLASDFLVLVANGTGDDGIITLPPVAEVAGQMFCILTIDATGNGVDVIDKGDALYSATEASTPVDVSSVVAIDAAGDFLLMFSTGITWICLAFNIG